MADTEPLLSDTEDMKLIATSKHIVLSFQNQDFAAIKTSFPWYLRLFLTEGRLAKLWRIAIEPLGEIESFSEPQIDKAASDSSRVAALQLPTANILLHHQKCNMGFQLRFTKSYQLLGAHFHPPVSLNLPRPWSLPSYVDPSSFAEASVSVRPSYLWPSLKGSLTLPKSHGPHPAVLLVPGSGNGDLDLSVGGLKIFKDLALGLASHGIAVLRLPKPMLMCLFKMFVTRNATAEDEYITHNLEGLRFLLRHPDVDKDRIFVAGISAGGRFLPRLALRAMEKRFQVAGLVSMAGPSRPLTEISRYQLEWLEEHFPRKDNAEYQRDMRVVNELEELISQPGFKPRWWTKNPSDVLTMPTPLTYLLDDTKTENDPIEIARALKMPMLFLQGSDDFQVRPKEEFEDGFQRALQGKEEAEFKLYDGLNHCFVRYEGSEKGLRQYDQPGHVEGEVLEDLVEWVKRERR